MNLLNSVRNILLGRFNYYEDQRDFIVVCHFYFEIFGILLVRKNTMYSH